MVEFFVLLLTLTLAICMSFQAAEAVDEITLSSSNRRIL